MQWNKPIFIIGFLFTFIFIYYKIILIIGGVMKKIASFGLFLILIGIILTVKDDILELVDLYIIPKDTTITLGEKNEYYRDYNFNFVQNTENFSPHSMQDILNIYYTAINAGKTSFTFNCPKEYETCIADVRDLANSQDKLSNINNYVHPYNGFAHIETEYDSLGKVTISIVKSYSEEDILAISSKIDELLPQLVNNNYSEIDNIRSIHNYIINNSKYDSLRSEQNIEQYRSDIAYGPLFEGYAICGGYTDLMELFLERLGVKSFKISSDKHIWNAVYLNDTWYHLDLTWDDPVASDGRDYLEFNYFLIGTDKLLSLDTTEHVFDQEVFSEFKNV